MANGFSVATFDKEAVPEASILNISLVKARVESVEQEVGCHDDKIEPHNGDAGGCLGMSVRWYLPPVVPERDRRVHKTKLLTAMKDHNNDEDKKATAPDKRQHRQMTEISAAASAAEARRRALVTEASEAEARRRTAEIEVQRATAELLRAQQQPRQALLRAQQQLSQAIATEASKKEEAQRHEQLQHVSITGLPWASTHSENLSEDSSILNSSHFSSTNQSLSSSAAAGDRGESPSGASISTYAEFNNGRSAQLVPPSNHDSLSSSAAAGDRGESPSGASISTYVGPGNVPAQLVPPSNHDSLSSSAAASSTLANSFAAMVDDILDEDNTFGVIDDTDNLFVADDDGDGGNEDVADLGGEGTPVGMAADGSPAGVDTDVSHDNCVGDTVDGADMLFVADGDGGDEDVPDLGVE